MYVILWQLFGQMIFDLWQDCRKPKYILQHTCLRSKETGRIGMLAKAIHQIVHTITSAYTWLYAFDVIHASIEGLGLWVLKP